jgi:hypothetical protein
MIHKLIFDSENYLDFFFDEEQIEKTLGEMTLENRDDHINLNHAPRSFKDIFKEPLIFNFSPVSKEDKNKPIPDIVVDMGRLFLNQKAYDVLWPLIKDDGEFLPVRYQEHNGYFFIPLQVVQPDKKVSIKNEWEDMVSLGFHEDEVKKFSIFRTEFDAFIGLYCQDSIKDAIEQAALTGLFITCDLANIFPQDRSEVDKPN